MNYYRQGPRSRGGGGSIQIGVPALTPMVKILILTHAGIWFLQVLLTMATGRYPDPLTEFLGNRPSAVFSGWIWQPFTYMFLHSGRDLFHLLFNMLFVWMFGGDLERAWGGKAFLRYYLVCGFGAGWVAAIAGILSGGPGASIPTIGASGAVYGLLAAFGILFAERTVLFMMIFPMKARTMALLLFGMALFYSLTDSNPGVSDVSHVAGAVVGFLFLKRAWRFGDFYKDLKWRYARRRFKVVSRKDDDFDKWVN